MMFGTMQQVGLYPPQFVTRPRIEREAVVVHLRNQNQPSAWEQVSHYSDKHGSSAMRRSAEFLGTEDRIRAISATERMGGSGPAGCRQPGIRPRSCVGTIKPDVDFDLGLFANLSGK